MSAQKVSPNDAEQEQAREQGRGIPWKELFLALACFYGTLLWANSIGGWVKISCRIARYIQRRRAEKKISGPRRSTALPNNIKGINPSNQQPT